MKSATKLWLGILMQLPVFAIILFCFISIIMHFGIMFLTTCGIMIGVLGIIVLFCYGVDIMSSAIVKKEQEKRKGK